MKFSKELIIKAHKLTKVIKKEFPDVNYRFQFGISIKYLLSNKEVKKMNELEGTERQIKFATDIRNYVIAQINSINISMFKILSHKDFCSKKIRLIKAIEKQKKAKVIIDIFVDDFKLQDVRAKMLDFITYHDKYTQKDLKEFKYVAKTIDFDMKDTEFKTTKLEYKKPEIKKVEKKTSTEKQVEKNNNNTKKVNYSNGPHYFSAKYDTFDCETGEFIVAGDLVWKDSEGIHKADNY